MSASTKKRPPSNVKRWQAPAVCLVLAAITFIVFGQTLQHGFSNYDDGDYVCDNPLVVQGLSLKGFIWVFTHADCLLYHPLTMLSLMADYQMHGLHAGGYHLTNILLHTASAILLFLILRQMTGAFWRSAFVAAVFAIHPLRVESVAWVAERKDVLGTFFFMLTLGAYVRYVQTPKSTARYLMVATVFVLALLSKPTVVTLPFVLLLLDYWPLRRAQSARRLILEKIPLLALAAGACAVTVLAAKTGIAVRAHVSMSSHIGNALLSYVAYLRQMVWPEGLAVFYPQVEKGYPAWAIAGSILVLALITGVALAFWRKRPWLLTGWLWYLGMLAPMIGIVQVGAFAHADRMTYLAQIGIYLAMTWLVAEWRLGRAVFGGLMAGAIIVLIVCAWKQAAYWQSSETLWTHTLACTTNNYVAQCNLANTLRDSGRVDDAMPHYQEALRIEPDYAPAHYNLGNAFYDKGRLDEAIARYQEALEINPDYVEAEYNFATALFGKGRLDEAIVHFQKALQARPNYEEAHNNLGAALFQRGRLDEAVAQFKIAMELKPKNAEKHFNLGLALFREGHTDEAISCFQDALQLKPDYAAAHQNLGLALVQKGRITEAISHYQQALTLAQAAGQQDLVEQLQGELKRCEAGPPLHQ